MGKGTEFVSNPFAVLGKPDSETVKAPELILPATVKTGHESFLGKVGDFFKGAGKDVEHVAPVVLGVAGEVLPLLPIPESGIVGKMASAAGTLLQGRISPQEGSKMNTLESLGIAVVLSVLSEVVKNPTTSAAVKSQLTGVATEILETYGYTVTPPAALPAAKETAKA
jgi:hypothetical protein